MVAIFSVLGVVCAFLGLSVFLLSMICLLPVNIYNAIISCMKLKHAIPLLDTSIIPTLFFGGSILMSIISLCLFYKITEKEQVRKSQAYGKTADYRATTPYNQTSHHNPFSHHKHSLLNNYTYSFVVINAMWVCTGSFLLHTLVSDDTTERVMEIIRSQVYLLRLNMIVLSVAASAMCVSSLFFAIGKSKKSTESTPLFSAV
ncbi:hypothetical protein BDF21DRAFT_492531 [Thamnidium elegans]|uniref:Uncharacterized protein n=1 Tax=Thamnidium elegans TaxID=101142 RepID=A0A8H7VRA2_9FUNG|nr:hypothetical protein INT48_003734 [Thamnidium elegans]KAI8083597.1 hypothetical protein BDF21DRAFT_492531 [Thamnidium elegans]